MPQTQERDLISPGRSAILDSCESAPFRHRLIGHLHVFAAGTPSFIARFYQRGAE